MRWAQMTLRGGDANAVVAAYSGAAVGTLLLVGSNLVNTCPTAIEAKSCATFPVTAGATYSVQVTGVSGARGAGSIELVFGWPAPSNNAFSTAVTTFPATGSVLGATMEKGEPFEYDYPGSVWYRFSARVGVTSAQVRQ
jgi:hypothetical protein